MVDQIRTWGPAATWAAVLFFLSSLRIGLEGGWWLAINDKVIHLCLYSVLGAALAFGRRSGGNRVPHLMMLGVGALYGASDEWHQSFVPGRAPSVGDWGADIAGVILGYGVMVVLHHHLTHGNEAKTKGTTA